MTISNVAFKDLKDSQPGEKIYAYGQFPANVAWNYISFKTNLDLRVLNDVCKIHRFRKHIESKC